MQTYLRTVLCIFTYINAGSVSGGEVQNVGLDRRFFGLGISRKNVSGVDLVTFLEMFNVAGKNCAGIVRGEHVKEEGKV